MPRHRRLGNPDAPIRVFWRRLPDGHQARIQIWHFDQRWYWDVLATDGAWTHSPRYHPYRDPARCVEHARQTALLPRIELFGHKAFVRPAIPGTGFSLN